ncbi:hypothetical protein ACFX5K_06150 [Rickettsiales bacterium LUAb2]
MKEEQEYKNDSQTKELFFKLVIEKTNLLKRELVKIGHSDKTIICDNIADIKYYDPKSKLAVNLSDKNNGLLFMLYNKNNIIKPEAFYKYTNLEATFSGLYQSYYGKPKHSLIARDFAEKDTHQNKRPFAFAPIVGEISFFDILATQENMQFKPYKHLICQDIFSFYYYN